jgi:hypothetical protein
MCPFATSAPHSPCFVRGFFANKQNGTAEARNLRARYLCVEPELSRCVSFEKCARAQCVC